MIVKTYLLPKHKQKVPFELTRGQRAMLVPIGDIHWGADDFPLGKLRTHIQWCMDRGAVFLGMGDYLDFTSATQRAIMRGLRGSTMKSMGAYLKESADELFEILEPTKGRWLGLLEGNHSWEFENGTSIDQYLAGKLKADFLGTSAMIRLVFRDTPKGHPEAEARVFCHHGTGGGRRQGGHLHRLEDLVVGFDADIYLMGHSHGKQSAAIDRQYVSPDGKHYHRTMMIARTGSWLRSYVSHEPLDLKEPAIESRGTYIEEEAYMPAALGSLAIGVGFEKIKDSKYYRPTIHYSV